ncbi:cupin domain-containing protein [uncultured Sphingomonas sp.]|uniref:cupin domain-containing protein n=1 Tax=uncultured Sphingomonas sp. TaxID=158754 RepID=UPI0030F8C771
MRMINVREALATAVMFVAAAAVTHAAAQTAPSFDHRDFASAKEVQAQVAAMLAEMKPGQGFAWRPLVEDPSHTVAVEIWKKPGRPAVHPAEAEYAVVLEGTGTLVSGGTLIAPATRRGGLVEGERIEGGATRALRKGDVLLIPAGVPHWFGITGERLVLLGTKLPVR